MTVDKGIETETMTVDKGIKVGNGHQEKRSEDKTER